MYIISSYTIPVTVRYCEDIVQRTGDEGEEQGPGRKPIRAIISPNPVLVMDGDRRFIARV
jgi:hypothetical protein